MTRQLICCMLLVCCSLSALASNHGVILLYHHVATDTPPSTSVTPNQFTAHLDYLKRHGYRVIPLRDLLDGIYRNGPTLPEQAVAITFDDAYDSIFETAYPLLAERKMPFTLFVATEAIDRSYRGYMSWQDLREMHASGLADIGAHSVSHSHLLEGGGAKEDLTTWTNTASMEIDAGIRRLQEQLSGLQVHSFAYPFGEWHPPLARLLSERGLYGLAQTSGAVSAATPETAIPRFPIAQGYANEQRLRSALQSLPLPVTDIEPGPMLITQEEPMPTQLSFQLAAGPYGRAQLACYASSGSRLSVERHQKKFNVNLPELKAGRNKVNCTAPSTTRPGLYHWFSQQWVVADAEGRWLTR